MTSLKLDINNQVHAKKLASFLSTLGYIKSVTIENRTNPTSEYDWILPGSQITDEELSMFINELEEDYQTGITTEQLKVNLAQWNKGIYK